MLGIAANKTSAKQFKFEFKLAAPLTGCLQPHLEYATAPKEFLSIPQLPPPFPHCPSPSDLAIVDALEWYRRSNHEMRRRLLRCCRSSAAVSFFFFFHFLATSWMPANCFCAPPRLTPYLLQPLALFHSFAWMRPLCLFVCSGNSSNSSGKKFFY